MEIARTAMDLDPMGYRVDAMLREITFGNWEGRTLDEIRAATPDQVAARERDKWGYRHPGGESYTELAERLTPWLAALKRPTVIAAHGGTGRVLWIELIGMDPGQAAAMDFPHDRVFLWRDGTASLV
jgi:probable phosphoglycerate mutase